MPRLVPSCIVFCVVFVSVAGAQQPAVPQPVSFATPIVFPSEGPFPTGIASGDFNNDGIPDIIVGDFAASAAVSALGNGDGTFGTWVGGCGAGEPVSAVAVGKFNGKNLDALANDIYGGVAAVCIGDGTGHFPSGNLLTVNPSNIVNGFITADFNGDGNDDLALVTGIDTNGAPLSIGELYVYPSNGDGTFQSPKVRTAVTNAVAIATGDFNNDGKADIVVLANDVEDIGGYVAVFLGNGKAEFSKPITFRIPVRHGNASLWPASIAVGDFNRDGKLDLALTFLQDSDRTANVPVLLGNGDGTFRKGTIAHAGPNPRSIAVADLNGDSIPDLVLSADPCYTGCDEPGGVSVLIGNGDGTFQPPQLFPVNGALPLLTVADFNGDGKPDVATANGDSRSISVLLNTTPWPKTIKK